MNKINKDNKIIEMFEIEKIKRENGKITFNINGKKYNTNIISGSLPSKELMDIIKLDIYILNKSGKITYSVLKDDFINLK